VVLVPLAILDYNLTSTSPSIPYTSSHNTDAAGAAGAILPSPETRGGGGGRGREGGKEGAWAFKSYPSKQGGGR